MKVRKCEPWIKLIPPDCDNDSTEESDELYIRGKDIAEVYVTYYEGKERPWNIEILTDYDHYYRIGEFSTKDNAKEVLIEFLREISNNRHGIRVTEMKKEGEIDF